MKTKRLGILSGTFDPIHMGHIEVCLVARGSHELDKVLVMIEKKPNLKDKVTDYKHRKKMVELALADFDSIKLFDTREDNLTFTDTSKHLRRKFPGYDFALIVGSDMLETMPNWPDFETWANNHSIIVVLRDNKDKTKTEKTIKQWAKDYSKLQLSILPAVWSPIASSTIRAEIKKSHHSDLVHRNVMAYVKKHQLYD